MTKAANKQHLGLSSANEIAVTIVLVSLGMLFATFLLCLFMFKLTATSWPPMGVGQVDLYPPLQSTLIILISSFTYHQFQKLFLKNDRNSKKFLNLTTVLGFLFLLSQIWIWNLWAQQGITASSGIYGSLLYVMTGIHGAHIIVSLLALLYVSYIFSNKEKK